MIFSFLFEQLRLLMRARMSRRELQHLTDRELDDVGVARIEVSNAKTTREDV